MKFTLLTLFPDLCKEYFKQSIMAKAVAKGLIDYSIINIRDYAKDKHHNCDDSPYGGGAGMVFLPEPLGAAFDELGTEGKRIIYPTPSGKLFNQAYAWELSNEKEIVLLCGRYEGIDQRIIDLYVEDEISIGDYILSSGEIAALTIVDSVFRLLEGVINPESLKEESFSYTILEYPHYTRPEEYKGLRVPEVLLSGHHAKIEEWRLKKGLEKTMKNRPELVESNVLPEKIKKKLKKTD